MRRFRQTLIPIMASSAVLSNPYLCSMASAPPNDGGDGNNGGDTGGGGGSGNQSENNGGHEFDPASFWVDPEPETPSPPAGRESAGTESGSGSPAPDSLAGTIQQQVAGFKAGDIFTNEAMEEVGRGNYETLHKNLDTAFQKSMEQNMLANVQVIKAVATQMMSRVEQMIQQHSTTKDNYSALRNAIPSANDPKVAPIIEGIYDRALTLSKNDSSKAIQMTKQMLKTMLNESSRDVDLNVAPISGDSGGERPKPINWLEALNQPQ